MTGVVPRTGRSGTASSATLLLALLAGCLVGGCSAGGAADRAQPGSGGTPTRVAVTPRAPHVAGPVRVELQAGLAELTGDACDPRKLCNADETETWVPIGRSREVVLDEAVTRIDAAHGSWTTVLRLRRQDRAALAAVTREAARTGGQVLVVRAGTVRADVQVPLVHGSRVVMGGLGKSAAWAAVTALDDPS